MQRAMDDDRPSDQTRQFEAPKYDETQYRTRTRPDEAGSVGTDTGKSAVRSQRFETPTQEEGQSRTRTRPDEVGSVGTAVNDEQGKAAQGIGQGCKGKASPGKGKGGFFKGLISGTVISDSIILKDVRYTAMIVLLAIIFIANRFNAERVEREISALEQEVRDLRAESLSVSAVLGSVRRQSEISDLVKERGLGLVELREPPYRIVVNE